MLHSVTPPNPPHPPEVTGDGDMLPAIPEIQVQPVRLDPAKLVSLELQLLLYAALLEPGVAEDDHVLVEHACEKVAERSEQSKLTVTDRTRAIQSSLRLGVIHGRILSQSEPGPLPTNLTTVLRLGSAWAAAPARGASANEPSLQAFQARLCGNEAGPSGSATHDSNTVMSVVVP